MKPQHNSKDAGTVVAQSKKDRGGRLATLPATGYIKLAKSGNINIRQFSVATYNVRTLNDTICRKTGELIMHKVDRIITGCEKYHIDLVAVQEHRLRTSNTVGYKKYSSWTMIYTDIRKPRISLAI